MIEPKDIKNMLERTENQLIEDYALFRGKCKEYCEIELKNDPTLKLVRGHYYCPYWGKQAHWWLIRQDGTIFDPTCRQFPSNGQGEYVEFDGIVHCSECGKEMKEEEAQFESNYCFCSGLCHGKFVGIY